MKVERQLIIEPDSEKLEFFDNGYRVGVESYGLWDCDALGRDEHDVSLGPVDVESVEFAPSDEQFGSGSAKVENTI